MHNLHIENRVHIVANNLNREREAKVTLNNVNKAISAEKLLQEKESTSIKPELEERSVAEDVISIEMNKMTIEEGFTEADGIFQCYYCVGTYKKKGHLKTHLENIHNKVITFSCKCWKKLPI